MIFQTASTKRETSRNGGGAASPQRVYGTRPGLREMAGYAESVTDHFLDTAVRYVAPGLHAAARRGGRPLDPRLLERAACSALGRPVCPLSGRHYRAVAVLADAQQCPQERLKVMLRTSERGLRYTSRALDASFWAGMAANERAPTVGLAN